MNKRLKEFQLNSKLAFTTWGEMSQVALLSLKELTRRHALSVAAGDLQFLDGRWYVTQSGLLRIAQRRHCFGIRAELQKDISSPLDNRWIFKARPTGSGCVLSRSWAGLPVLPVLRECRTNP